MNDSRDLKAIAEACQQHQPLRFMRSHGALYIRNESGIVFDVHQNRSFPEFMAQNKDYADLVLAANPETILALIAENERLHESDQEATELCDTLSALLGEIAVAVRGPEEPKSRHGFNDLPSRVKTVVAERDQLRAEVAGLKTGYEAYERVNAELKAENEVLLSALKGMTSMYGHCWDLVDGGLLCMQDNVQRFEDAHEAAQKVIAAMGQGEQS